MDKEGRAAIVQAATKVLAFGLNEAAAGYAGRARISVERCDVGLHSVLRRGTRLAGLSRPRKDDPVPAPFSCIRRRIRDLIFNRNSSAKLRKIDNPQLSAPGPDCFRTANRRGAGRR
jgi:hypothetical protein